MFAPRDAEDVATQPLLVEIEVAFNPSTDFVVDFALAQKRIQTRAFGGDQRKLHAMNAGRVSGTVAVQIAGAVKLGDSLLLSSLP